MNEFTEVLKKMDVSYRIYIVVDIDSSSSSSVKLLPLMSNITARAAYPKILVEDIRTDVDIQISDVNFLWQRFSLGKLNYDLAIPMTADEVSVCMYVCIYPTTETTYY